MAMTVLDRLRIATALNMAQLKMAEYAAAAGMAVDAHTLDIIREALVAVQQDDAIMCCGEEADPDLVRDCEDAGFKVRVEGRA